MLIYAERQERVAYHTPVPSGPIPTVCDEEGIYPYESFSETAKRPALRKLRMVDLENDWLKVTVCPDLGGKIRAILDKTSGRELLFDSGTVRPVRILPRMAFISGGIEVSFPIAHTPVQIESVRWEARETDGRVYVWCGEREVRYGMHWTVEYSLGPEDRFLTQRACFFNPTEHAHAWMSWSNAALPARPDSRFYFPSGRVLRHADTLETIEWDGSRPYLLKEFDRMQGFFWKTADRNAFGMYTPSLQAGLYHIADPAEMPGIKLWLYGLGRDEVWAHLTSARKESYVEIQAGPLLEQADNRKLGPGERHLHTEFWVPASRPMTLDELELPRPELIGSDRIPLFDWSPRACTAVWAALVDAWRAGDAQLIPEPPADHSGCWPPSGMELEEALQWAAANAGEEAEPSWRYYSGVWLAGRSRYDEALEALRTADIDASFALQGRLLRKVKHDAAASREAFDRIVSPGWRLHPQIAVERDLTLSLLGASALEERRQRLAETDSLNDDGLVERRACFLFDAGDYTGARGLLEQAGFEKVHQRYFRTRLWQEINLKLGERQPFPAALGEDDLAVYGAYRVQDSAED